MSVDEQLPSELIRSSMIAIQPTSLLTSASILTIEIPEDQRHPQMLSSPIDSVIGSDFLTLCRKSPADKFFGRDDSTH